MNLSRHVTAAARWPLAGSVVGLVALGTALVGPAAVAVEPTQRQVVSAGNLDWGFKESFRAYVEGPIADGGIEVYDPATRLPDGSFRWSQASGRVNATADTAKLSFKGEVYFYGHDFGQGPALEVWLDEPRIQINGDTGVIIADVTSRDMASGVLTEYDDVVLADLDTTGVDLAPNSKRIVKVTDVPAELTAEGAEAFAGFYAAGEELDPIDFRVKLRP